MVPPLSARMQFLCEKRQLEFRHDVPAGIVGRPALSSPAMQPMFEKVMRPIVLEHARAALDACEDKCSSKGCERAAKTIVATPMSYLHNEADPFVIIMTVACCGTDECDRTLKREAMALMRGMAGVSTEQATASFGFGPLGRNSKCYCGSSHKYKKCCGKDEVAAA